jgi:hypothetical protein
MDRETPVNVIDVYLLTAVIDDADSLVFSSPFGESGVMFATLDGPRGDWEFEPGRGWFIDLVKRCLRERGTNVAEARGVVSGRLETLGQPSFWDFKWVEEGNEVVLTRIRETQPGACCD